MVGTVLNCLFVGLDGVEYRDGEDRYGCDI